jgi:membrane protease YdiL (CAAX protease family)
VPVARPGGTRNVGRNGDPPRCATWTARRCDTLGPVQQGQVWGPFGRVLAVAAAWTVLARWVGDHGWRLMPRALLGRLTLQGYLTLTGLVVAAVGCGLGWLLLERPREDLAWRPAPWRQIGAAALLAPTAYVLAVTAAVSAALPLLKSELLARGVEQVQQDTGQFGRELQAGALGMLLVWGVFVSPVVEELLFRGPMWSAINRLVRILAAGNGNERGDREGLPPSMLSESLVLKLGRALGRWLRTGGVATLASACVFGALHGGMPGALGFVRVVTAVGLGLACGQARHQSGSVLAAITVHVVYNALAVGTSRRWFMVEGWHSLRGVPWAVLLVAAVCLVVLSVLTVAQSRRRRAHARDSS